MLVSVIIPTFRDWQRLHQCLKALEKQSLSDQEFEVIIVNNDENSECPYQLPRNARIVLEANPGSYAARNRGVDVSSGTYLAFTDSDCLPHQDWINAALTRLGSEVAGTRVTGPIKMFREAGGSLLAFIYEERLAFQQRLQVTLRGSCVTANLVVARESFLDVGAFKETHYSGGDNEWNMRATRAGLPIVFDENVLVYHPARRNFREIARKERRKAGARALNTNVNGTRYVLARLAPPIRREIRDDAPPLGWFISFRIFVLLWVLGAISVIEFLLVRLRLKVPERA